MKKITITALSEVGKIAIKKHVKQSKRFIVRTTFKKLGLKQQIENEDPLTLCFSLPEFLGSKAGYLMDFENEIHKFMEKEQANRNEDYSIIVEEVQQ